MKEHTITSIRSLLEADERLRRAERAYAATASLRTLAALNKARVSQGQLPILDNIYGDLMRDEIIGRLTNKGRGWYTYKGCRTTASIAAATGSLIVSMYQDMPNSLVEDEVVFNVARSDGNTLTYSNYPVRPNNAISMTKYASRKQPNRYSVSLSETWIYSPGEVLERIYKFLAA